MDTQVLAEQQKFTLTSFVRRLDAVKRTYQEWCSRGMDDKKESEESMVLAYFDDDDHDDVSQHL